MVQSTPVLLKRSIGYVGCPLNDSVVSCLRVGERDQLSDCSKVKFKHACYLMYLYEIFCCPSKGSVKGTGNDLNY